MSYFRFTQPMMFTVLLFSLASGDKSPELELVDDFREHVVTLYQPGNSFASLNGYPYSIVFSGKKFQCTIGKDRQDKEDQEIGAAVMERLKGLCLESGATEICAGEFLREGDKLLEHVSDELVQGDNKLSQKGITVLSKYGNFSAPKIVGCACLKTSSPDKPIPCLIGSETSFGRIVAVDSPNKLVKTRKSDWIPWSQVGCDTDGSWDSKRKLERSQLFEGGEGVDYLLHSSLCCLSPPWAPLALHGVCTFFSWNDKILRYCHGSGISFVRQEKTVDHSTEGELEVLMEEDFSVLFERLGRRLVSNTKLPGKCSTVSMGYEVHLLEGSDLRSMAYEKTLLGLFQTPDHGKLSDRILRKLATSPPFAKAVGGSFNPQAPMTAGVLVHQLSNKHQCQATNHSTSIPWIAVASRGECMFQTKAQKAQESGASALLIVNNPNRGMIKWMAGLKDEALPDIVTGLLNSGDGLELKEEALNGVPQGPPSNPESPIRTLVESTRDDDPIAFLVKENLDKPLNLEVEFYCDERWRERPWDCQVGDEVAVEIGAEVSQTARVVDLPGNGRIGLFLFDSDRNEFSSTRTEISAAFVFKDKDWSCAGSSQIAIRSFDVQGCHGVLRIHSSSLCGMKDFRGFPRREVAIDCEL